MCERRAKTRDDARVRSVSQYAFSFSSHASITRETSPARPGRRHHSMKTLCARRIAPGDGFGAKTPPSLSSIQCLGALRRFKCFLSPLAMFLVRRQSFASRKGGGRTTTRRDRRAPAPRARVDRRGLVYTHHGSRSLLNTRYTGPIDAWEGYTRLMTRVGLHCDKNTHTTTPRARPSRARDVDAREEAGARDGRRTMTTLANRCRAAAVVVPRARRPASTTARVVATAAARETTTTTTTTTRRRRARSTRRSRDENARRGRGGGDDVGERGRDRAGVARVRRDARGVAARELEHAPRRTKRRECARRSRRHRSERERRSQRRRERRRRRWR